MWLLSPRFALRDATAGIHRTLDERLSRHDLTSHSGYSDFLLAHALAFPGVEAALAQSGAEDLVPGWTARRRSAALRNDLEALGVPWPAPFPAPVFADEASVLGGVYVLEGSRLGGALLIRSVPPTFPKSFLAPGNPAVWRAFVEVLDQRLSSPAGLENAVAAACAVFELFAAADDSLRGAERT